MNSNLKDYTFKKELTRGGHHIEYRCYFNGEVVGKLDVFLKSEKVNYEVPQIGTKCDWIWGVRTADDHQHKGIASFLMAWALADGKKRDTKYVGLNCQKHRISFYEQFGFVAINDGQPWSYHMLLSYRGKEIVLQKVS